MQTGQKLGACTAACATSFAKLPTSLAQARSFQNLGDRPLVVVTAGRDALAGWLPLQDRLATVNEQQPSPCAVHA
jgi:hypothetical protein